MITLRPYQEQLIQGTRMALSRQQSVLLQCPTGGGKTAMASYMVKSCVSKGKRAYFTVHRSELLDQTAGTFDKFDITYGFISAQKKMDLYHSAQICSIDTLKNRIHKIPVPDLAVIDESHHASSLGWSKVVNHWVASGTKIVGLSATPTRLDGKGLGDHFGELIPGPTPRWLMDNGYLSGYSLFAPSHPDTSSLHNKMGDFVNSEAEEMMDKPSITGDIIKHWKKHALGKKTILFAVSIKHSKHMAEEFQANGIKAIHLDGKTPPSERKQIARDFALGNLDIICQVNLFGEGYDIAAQSGLEITIDCVILARPTQSLSLFLQQIGRALRPKSDGSKAIILDHASNCINADGSIKHGFPDDDRIWTLEGTKDQAKKRRNEDQDINIRQCGSCYAVHRFAPVCPICGFEYPIQDRKIKEVEGDLQEIDTERLRKQARMDQGKSDADSMVKNLGYSRGRANHILESRREKISLQNKLKELIKEYIEKVGPVDINMGDVMKMKPKALKSNIAELENGLSEFGVEMFMGERGV